MFDEYKILEYLLNKAYKRVRISYRKIYEQFGVGADDNNDEPPGNQVIRRNRIPCYTRHPNNFR